MQRYSAASCSGGVSNSAVGGPSARDTARSDSSFPSSNFSLNSRRQLQLIPYKLKCDKEPLNSRLGPPDFYPQTPNCLEETLTREYLQTGYRETVEGIEESREIILSQASSITKPVNLKCREAIRKRHRAINESRVQKRKAGQVYGVPLSGQLLLKPGIFPEQRPCSEDFRKKWIESLSQQHKRLRSLADHVPHGYRRKSLFEVLIRHNVPLLRATWFIKITYLNQVRPASAGVSSGSPDKTQLVRTELWTKDVIEYLQILWDELFSKDVSHSNLHGRDHSPQTLLASSVQQKGDLMPTTPNGEEPALQFKWCYMVHIVQWHHAEGLLLSSAIIEWVLNQLQDKESHEAFQFLLPIVFNMIESISLSQTYVRMLVEVAVRFIRDLSPSGSELPDNPSRHYIFSSLCEMIRYLMLAVPDTFVALDCFPLPSCIFIDARRNVIAKDVNKVQYSFIESINKHQSCFNHVASSVQKRASNLAMAVSPGLQGCGVAKVVQTLDKALIQGDIRGAYNCLFENFCDEGIEEGWIAEVSPCLRSSLKWIGAVNHSVICSVFLLCEWATCDFRDCRGPLSLDVKFTGRKDFSEVYVAVLLLKLKMEDMQTLQHDKGSAVLRPSDTVKGASPNDTFSGGTSAENVSSFVRNNLKGSDESMDLSDVLQSPGPLHDIVVCWLDQHEVSKGQGFKRLQMLVVELIRFGIFYPQAYVRQLIISGIVDRNDTLADLERRKRHHRILKQLPGSYMHDALRESKRVEGPLLDDAIRIYSHERQLVLHEIQNGKLDHLGGSNNSSTMVRQKDFPLSGKHGKAKVQVAELKTAISVLLHLPNATSVVLGSQLDMFQGNAMKRPIGSVGMQEGTPGCEECKRAKRQKLSDEKSSHLQPFSPNMSDDEDTWWVRKSPAKILDFSLKVEQPKSSKHSSRGRQKIVRKTQSLAQLAAARIEGSQGASTSHVCDNKISCPHHRSGTEGDVSKLMDGTRMAHDAVSIGKALKQLRLLEKRSIILWLITSIKQLVDGGEKSSFKLGQCGGPFSPPLEEKSSERWKLGEEELSSILYMLDVSSDLLSAVRFLLWLLPKALISHSSTVHGGRNLLLLPKSTEGHLCEVGESFLLSSIRRYENILIAADLLPEALSAVMRRAEAVMASNGRASNSVAFIYARYLLKKYGSVASVIKWEKSFKVTCDQRLLAELELGRPLDNELGFLPISIPTGVEDVDDYFRQKISSRISRAGPTMKEIVQRHIEEAVHYFYGKERKFFAAPSSAKGSAMDKSDDGYQIAQQIVLNLVDCIRQNGGAAQEPDPSVVAAAISAIMGNVGPAIAKMPDFTGTSNYPPSLASSATSLNCVRRIIHIHITCLFLLKEALGGRLCRIFEIALAGEAFSGISAAFSPGKHQARAQFQLSPETHDSSSGLSNENLNNSTKIFLSRATKAAAAVSALVVGVIVHGVISLERMVTCFKLKEGLDVLQFIRGGRSTSNGVSRSLGAYKVENTVEIYLHWFRLLLGNVRMVSEGLVVELLGEPYALALCRMQRMLPLNLVLLPAYSIFGMVIWRPYILNSNIAPREDIQIHQSLLLAINEAIRHQPFRDLLLRDTQAFYEMIATDVSDSEFAAMLELHNPDKHSKTMAFVPSRARLFLNAILDCRMPQSVLTQDDGSWIGGHGDTKIYPENETKLLDQLVQVLDTLQPAKFHWQWVELRLLLNEQVLIEKIETHNISLVEAIRSLSPNSENFTLSENENNFTEIVLTRLLVRPDAAPLYSEVVHLLGRSMEESLLLHAKWFLAGNDVLLGRKSIRQRLVNVAQLRGLSTRVQFWKPWGWSSSVDLTANRGEKKKLEASSLEEGEVVEEGIDLKKPGRSLHLLDFEGFNSSEQFVTERALAQLVLPCIDRSSSDSRSTFASDLIKQMNTIEQQISGLTRGATKQGGSVSSSAEGGSNKGTSRKGGLRGGSPGLGRRSTGVADSAPPTAAALRASMWLRLQFLLRLLPFICADREPSVRNMRHLLATVLLRLLGSRVVYEDADFSFFPIPRQNYPFKKEKETESSIETSGPASVDLTGDSLFDRLLCVLHGLLSTCKPSWLKPSRSASRLSVKSPRDFSVFDREAAENLQVVWVC
ncbi:mediator of RNA polymerase II transcription subunit 12-like isoform X2 [Aristolochia californica]|uniref:mediator of RNA polymerase II transcription subunit 12-like isoform X2 n=1 Tax=Aristolochia californica TaxID=171875 RepID=UPI0035D56401